MSHPILVVPPLTPFEADGTLHVGAIAGHVDYVLESCRPDFVVAAGVEAQEYAYLSFEARQTLLRTTIEAVDGRAPVIAGISHPSFHTAISLANFAAEHGAKVLQVLAPLRPFGGAPTPDEVLAYIELILRETDLPLMLYLNAGPGADLSVDATLAIARLPRVQYIKESSRDLTRVGRLIEEIDHAGHAHYLTTTQMLLPSLLLGGSGATMPPPLAALGARVLAAYRKGDIAEAARVQRQFSLFPAKWMHRGLAPTMKAALRYLGQNIGDPHLPFGVLREDERAALHAFLDGTDLKSGAPLSAADTPTAVQSAPVNARNR
ncbi:dihydrodipicolinate synthase family protein [Chitinasiproducens palmae]|uniref:4-hydroxy-tetrahydrodipicolinate synthase n=1 Tax=Chitinasiproducens palmae TaxID=1770053 RepID=A0A1H2PR75_9BURK|nr:dihydrodipicolinate synthase family protein [Chitinasiproducens palmae]SDV48966.1 4-hydroxy-tetrahydrodipicolinate synthase [Chitinasiproducens palmae]